VVTNAKDVSMNGYREINRKLLLYVQSVNLLTGINQRRKNKMEENNNIKKVLVILESPFAGDVEKNLEYARKCMKDCFMRGEFPFASHLLYTQDGILDDTIPEERKLGIEAGLIWGGFAEITVVYTDLGITEGMKQGIERAKKEGRKVDIRKIKDMELI